MFLKKLQPFGWKRLKNQQKCLQMHRLVSSPKAGIILISYVFSQGPHEFKVWTLNDDEIMVRDDFKLPDDSGKIPKLSGVVGGSILCREIVSLFDGKLVG